jgi:hypothetical protein
MGCLVRVVSHNGVVAASGNASFGEFFANVGAYPTQFKAHNYEKNRFITARPSTLHYGFFPIFHLTRPLARVFHAQQGWGKSIYSIQFSNVCQDRS